MTDDRGQVVRLSEEEYAALRQAKFGDLPPRVTPTELVETVETDLSHEEPAEPQVRQEWG